MAAQRLTAAPREEDQGRDPEPCCWRWPRSGGSIRRGSAASVCRSFANLLRFNARGPDGLSMGHRAHPRSSWPITDEAGPVPAVDGVPCAGGARTWRGGSSPSKTTRLIGFAKISARSRQRTAAARRLVRATPERRRDRAVVRRWPASARSCTADPAVVTRPRAPRDQRTEWAYIFGASVPRRGWRRAGHALVRHRPWRRTSGCRRRSRRPCAARSASRRPLAIPDAWTLPPSPRPLCGECLAQRVEPDLQILRRPAVQAWLIGACPSALGMAAMSA